MIRIKVIFWRKIGLFRFDSKNDFVKISRIQQKGYFFNYKLKIIAILSVGEVFPLPFDSTIIYNTY